MNLDGSKADFVLNFITVIITAALFGHIAHWFQIPHYNIFVALSLTLYLAILNLMEERKQERKK